MIELTPSAQNRLDDYLNEMRRVLTGSPSVDLADVERDIRDHIDAALAGQVAPVEALVLDNVLQSLGKPSQWLPEAETAWYRRSPSTWPAASEAARTPGRSAPCRRTGKISAGLFVVARARPGLVLDAQRPIGQSHHRTDDCHARQFYSVARRWRYSARTDCRPVRNGSSIRACWPFTCRSPRSYFLGQSQSSAPSAIKNENDFKAASQGKPPHKHVQRGAALHELEKRPLDTKMWNVSLNPIKVACGLTAVAAQLVPDWAAVALLPAWFASSFTLS